MNRITGEEAPKTNLEQLLSSETFHEQMVLAHGILELAGNKAKKSNLPESEHSSVLAGTLVVCICNAYALGLKHGDKATPIALHRPEWLKGEEYGGNAS